MTLPDNIKKLLCSRNHEDRAIGISLLVEIPNYKDLFTQTYDRTTKFMIIPSIDNIHSTIADCTIINTDNNSYWINLSHVFIHIGEKALPWNNSGAKTINI